MFLKKLAKKLVILSCTLIIFLTVNLSGETYTPPYIDAFIHEHSWQDTDLGVGFGIIEPEIYNHDSFSSNCTVVSGTPYGHAAMTVLDDYRIPISVSQSGRYQVRVDVSLQGAVTSAEVDAFLAATSAASEGILYVMTEDSSYDLVSQIERRVLWDEDYSVTDVINENGSNAVEAAFLLVNPTSGLLYWTQETYSVISDITQALSFLDPTVRFTHDDPESNWCPASTIISLQRQLFLPFSCHTSSIN